MYEVRSYYAVDIHKWKKVQLLLCVTVPNMLLFVFMPQALMETRHETNK